MQTCLQAVHHGMNAVSSACRLDRINQVDLPLDSYYRSGDYDGRGVHGETT